MKFRLQAMRLEELEIEADNLEHAGQVAKLWAARQTVKHPEASLHHCISTNVRLLGIGEALAPMEAAA